MGNIIGYGFNENCIEWVKDQERTTVSLSQRRIISRVEKLALERPEECQIVARNADGSICAHVPVTWIKISPPAIRTENQREQARLNVMKIRSVGREKE